MSGEITSDHLNFCWSGSGEPFLDAPDVIGRGHTSIGRYGGTASAGAHKNEDAALVWTAGDGAWTFAALLDAHGSSESADLVLNRIAELEADVVQLLDNNEEQGLPLCGLSTLVTRHLGAEDFRQACSSVKGETALMLCVQKGAYLWWLSVGDIPVYVFHPEFARLGQFALNQRMFFEWVGQVNTFALPVPCYSTGVRQLRAGRNRVLLTTDGLLECGTRALENPQTLYDLFDPEVDEYTVGDALDHVESEQGRDSTTLIAWDVEVPPSEGIMQPSA